MKAQHVFLNWIPTGWNTPKPLRGVPHSQRFTSLDELKQVMSKHLYGGEWVTDAEGNRVDIDLKGICAKEARWEDN